MKREHTVSIDSSLCNRCGLCVGDCTVRVIAIAGGGAEHSGKKCLMCGHCVAICPKNAVSISGFADEPEDIDPGNKVDPDAFLALVKSRRSMRQFKSSDVPKELIEKIIDAGRYSPTGSNRQGATFVVIKDLLSACEKIAVTRLRLLKPLYGIFRP